MYVAASDSWPLVIFVCRSPWWKFRWWCSLSIDDSTLDLALCNQPIALQSRICGNQRSTKLLSSCCYSVYSRVRYMLVFNVVMNNGVK
jgi:hypothetical protein